MMVELRLRGIPSPGRPSQNRREIKDMWRNKRAIWFVSLAASSFLLGASNGANAQGERPERPGLLAPGPGEAAPPPPTGAAPVPPPTLLRCKGPISSVLDFAYEGLKTTTAVFGWNPPPGGG